MDDVDPHEVLPEALAVLEQAAKRGLDVGDLTAKTTGRLANAEAFRDAYAAYVRPTDGLEGDLITPTRHRVVNLSSPEERDAARQWWLDLTATGGEGMVVKPAHLTEGGSSPDQGAWPGVPPNHLRTRLHRRARRTGAVLALESEPVDPRLWGRI